MVQLIKSKDEGIYGASLGLLWQVHYCTAPIHRMWMEAVLWIHGIFCTTAESKGSRGQIRWYDMKR